MGKGGDTISADVRSLLYQFDDLKLGVEALNEQKITATFVETNMACFIKMLDSIKNLIDTLDLLKQTLNRDVYKGIEAIKQIENIDIELCQKMNVYGSDTSATYDTYQGFDIKGNHSSVRVLE